MDSKTKFSGTHTKKFFFVIIMYIKYIFIHIHIFTVMRPNEIPHCAISNSLSCIKHHNFICCGQLFNDCFYCISGFYQRVPIRYMREIIHQACHSHMIIAKIPRMPANEFRNKLIHIKFVHVDQQQNLSGNFPFSLNFSPSSSCVAVPWRLLLDMWLSMCSNKHVVYHPCAHTGAAIL